MEAGTFVAVNGEDLAAAMAQAIARVDKMTNILDLVYLLVMIIAVVCQIKLKNNVSHRASLLVNLVGSLNGLVVLIWIYSINRLVYWVRPDGTEDIALRIGIRVMMAILVFCSIYDAYFILKMPAKIPVLILDPERMRGYKATGDQPFVYPYREGTGEGPTTESTETGAVLGGNEP